MPKEIIESPDVFPLKNYKNLDPPHGVPINMAVKVSGAVMYNKVVPVNKEGVSVAPEDCLVQTRQVLENLAAMVKAAGAKMTDVVATTWYTTDIDAYYGSDASQLRREFFPDPFPTSVVIEISRLAQPEWKVEMLAVVSVPE